MSPSDVAAKFLAALAILVTAIPDLWLLTATATSSLLSSQSRPCCWPGGALWSLRGQTSCRSLLHHPSSLESPQPTPPQPDLCCSSSRMSFAEIRRLQSYSNTITGATLRPPRKEGVLV